MIPNRGMRQMGEVLQARLYRAIRGMDASKRQRMMCRWLVIMGY